MLFKDFLPTPPLDNLVQIYRLRHFVIPNNIVIPAKPYPPRPENCIAFYLRGFEVTRHLHDEKSFLKPRSVITGQYTHRIDRISSPVEFLMIQVVFKPGALFRLTGIPFNEMQNTHVDLESVFPKEGRMVNDRLGSCNNYREMIMIVEKFLVEIHLKIKVPSRTYDEVFNLLLASQTKYSLKWLASQSCLSTRQFERKSNQYLGICPQLFARIVRFNQSYELRLKKPGLDWLSIAVACDYHDYQHLVRDFKEFTQVTPNMLFAAESKVLERALGLNKK